SFKLGLDNEAFAYDQYAQTQPEIVAYLKQKLDEFHGRFAIGSCTYGQPLSVFINEESNVRQLTYAIRTNLAHFGQTPEVYAISEHALHSQIPQLARQCGYKAAMMRTHFMMYGYNPTYPAAYGLWQGADGTQIPTVPTYDGEGAEFGVTTYDNWILTRWPDQTDRSLEDFAQKFPDMRPLLASRYDDIVLRCEKLTQYVEAHRGQYRWILLEEIPELFGEPQMVFAPTANEFRVRMPWGYCGNRIFNDCRRGELDVLTAERLNAWEVLAGGESRQALLEESWKNLMVTQHHDVQICGLMDDERNFIARSLDASAKVREQSLSFLTRQFTTGGDRYVMVYNPLSWPLTQRVECEVAYPRGKGGPGFSLWFAGQELPCEYEVLDRKETRISRAMLRFELTVPAQTARCCRILAEPGALSHAVECQALDGTTLETPFYALGLDEGGIRSLRRGDVCWFRAEQGALFAGVIDGKPERSRGIWSATQRGSLVEAEYLGRIGSIGIRFTMRFAGERIDCRVTFSHHGEKIGSARKYDEFKENQNGFLHEDKLRFLLPMKLDDAHGVRDLPFLIEETEDAYIQGNYWTACGDGGLGVACFNKGAMCMVREENSLSIPLEYANRYVWGDRMLVGDITHEFALLPFAGSWRENDLHRKALAYAFPLGVQPVAPGQQGKWEHEKTFLDLACSDNVILSALYPENGAVIARIYEAEGREGRFSLGDGDATVVDLLGAPNGDAVPEALGAHRILSVRLASF
ncbi:MAG: hypothetical protein ACI4XW_14290, partial [Candidatus Spyradocola sp.]